MDCVTLNYRLSHALTDYVQALDVSLAQKHHGLWNKLLCKVVATEALKYSCYCNCII